MLQELFPGSHSVFKLSIEENMVKTQDSQFIKLETLAIRIYRRPFTFMAGAQWLGYKARFESLRYYGTGQQSSYRKSIIQGKNRTCNKIYLCLTDEVLSFSFSFKNVFELRRFDPTSED